MKNKINEQNVFLNLALSVNLPILPPFSFFGTNYKNTLFRMSLVAGRKS